MIWAGHVTSIGTMRSSFNILIGKPEEKKSLVRSRRRCEDNFKKYLRNIRCEFMDWIQLATMWTSVADSWQGDYQLAKKVTAL